MKQRVITGVALVILLIAVLALGTPFVEIAVALLAVVAVTELFNATRLSGNKMLLLVAVIGTAFLVTVQCFGAALFTPAMYVYIVVLFAVYMANMQTVKLKDIAKTFFITIYIVFLFAHIILVRNMEYGHLLIWLVLIGAFVTDTAALFGGKFFGKHKLCPKLSPKKTVEGSIGGVVANMIVFAGYAALLKGAFDVNANVIFFAILGALFSAVGQFGDLIASGIKRHFGIKDYGKLFPGHGGVLDRFDSTLAIAGVMLLVYAAFGSAFLIH